MIFVSTRYCTSTWIHNTKLILRQLHLSAVFSARCCLWSVGVAKLSEGDPWTHNQEHEWIKLPGLLHVWKGEVEVKGIQLQPATSPVDVTKAHTLNL